MANGFGHAATGDANNATSGEKNLGGQEDSVCDRH